MKLPGPIPGSRVGAWLAMAAMALQAAWPLLAQAQPKSAVLVPVCSVGGTTHYLELPVPGQTSPSLGHRHCAYCAHGADRIPCVAASSGWQEFESAGAEALSPHVAVPAARPVAHSPARPRAPPIPV